MAAQSWRDSVRDVFGVLVDAARLFGRHWPVLLTLAFLGVAVRGAAHWSAVAISDHVGWLAQIVLVVAPLGYLLPVIAMLHLCRRDRPGLRSGCPGPPAPTRRCATADPPAAPPVRSRGTCSHDSEIPFSPTARPAA